MTLENKWIRGAIPALFIHCCIGSVYCWSLLKDNIAAAMSVQTSSIEFAFSLAIFFLGMSAAFAGRFVEQQVKYASLVSCICFVTGLLGTIVAIDIGSVALLMLCYGALMGVGLGIGYLSPVKTLMIWFSEHKGLATGIAISGFGLSKVLFSPFIEWCNSNYGINTTLFSMSLISLVLMLIASLLIKKPNGWKEKKTKFSWNAIMKILTNPTYIKIWIIFYLNITCGLALISFEKSIGLFYGITAIGLLSALTAAFNTIGRFGYSTLSDYFNNKAIIYLIIFGTSVLGIAINIITLPMLFIIVMLCIINAGYGGGFSTLPTLLESKFGMKQISMIHGFALSAWAWAGLSGNQLSNLIINKLNGTYTDLFIVLSVLYFIALLITIDIYRKKD